MVEESNACVPNIHIWWSQKYCGGGHKNIVKIVLFMGVLFMGVGRRAVQPRRRR